MPNTIRRTATGLVVAAALAGLGTGVATAAEEPPSGTIQEVGGTVAGVEESSGAAAVSDEVGEATGATQVEDELGVTKAEEGLGLG